MASVKELLDEYDEAKSARRNWDTLWQEVHDLTWPYSANFTAEQAQGEPRTERIFDSTPALALEKFGAVLESLTTPRHQRFQNFRASNPYLMRERSVALYFEQVTDLIFRLRARPRSGYYDQAQESHKALGAYGNQCRHTVPSRDRMGISYRHIHVGSVWIMLDDRGQADTVYYGFKLTAKQALQKWGKLAPECAQKAIEQNKPGTEHEYLHVVKPRRLIQPWRLGAASMPWESWEISLDDKAFIPIRNEVTGAIEESGGFRTFPYTYSRMSTNPAEVYGRGPAMLVLGDNRVLQEQEHSSLLYGQMSVTPPLLAQNIDLMGDGASRLDLRPRAVNPGWLDSLGRERVKPLMNAFNLQESEVLKDSKRASINDAHLITLFQILVNSPEMTATEALIRAQEKGQLIAPVVGRQQNEWLGPETERELSIAAELRLLPEMPPALKEAQGEYEIEYTSAATRIQQEESVQAIRATFVDVAGITTIDGTAKEVLDAPGAVRFIAEARGVPRSLIRNEREFAKIIEMQARKSQRDEAITAAPMLAKAAKDAKAAGVDLGA